jgi:hypothetical protein
MLSFPLMAGLDINGACRDACLTERSVGPPLVANPVSHKVALT